MEQPSIVERLSNASLPLKDDPDALFVCKQNYNEVKTPDTLDIEGGALRPGGAPNMYSKENIGVLAQFAATGVVYGTLLGVVYPFLNNYLRMTGTQTSSASALLALPWTWRVFFGIISDCYPICGYRRRPYVVIGWLVCFVACFLMAVLPIGEPKYSDPALAFIPEANLTAEQIAAINYDAPSSGVKYILLLVLANIGCAISVTVASGIMVDLAQREPENVRGSLQTMTYCIQEIFQCVSTAMIGYSVAAASFYLTKKYGLGWSWRSMLVITQIAVVVIDLIPSFFTIWDVYRAQWFWLGSPIVGYLPYCIGYAISTFAIIEIIDVGNEAGVLGLIMTVSTLASPFSTVLSKNVCALFDVDYEFLQIDDTYVRNQVTYVYIIGYGLKLFSMVFVLLLPRQKAETQELKRTGGKSKFMGNLTIFYLVFAFCWSLMTNLMAFSSKTSCLVIAGGSGCD
ncbi:uncharacterized protein PITG_05620 [Globisporangium polare]